MNWKGKIHRGLRLLTVLFALYGGYIFIFEFLRPAFFGSENSLQPYAQFSLKSTSFDDIEPTSVQTEEIRAKMYPEASFEEISPNNSEIVTIYRQTVDPIFFEDEIYFTDDTVLMLVRGKSNYSNQRIIFSGDARSGNPHWLGDRHVFFTAYCGTSCRGLYLVDVNSKKTLTGVLTFMFSDSQQWYTVFKDWFGNEITFPGFVKEMRSETKNDLTMLLVYTEDINDHDLGTKRFKFTGKSLVAVD